MIDKFPELTASNFCERFTAKANCPTRTDSSTFSKTISARLNLPTARLYLPDVYLCFVPLTSEYEIMWPALS